ncbi:MAG: XRE family transcriptional regulator [Betaproteobacteria bacterium]|nr:XRE family transcriptional regulator [Betaproteobacteria bacterium]
MAQSAALVEALKRALKAKGVTYAGAAKALGLSEPTVKRMFSSQDFTLRRLDRLCELADIDLPELARSLEQKEHLLARLSTQQERDIVGDRKLMLVALCAMNGWTAAQITAAYALSEAECTRLLVKLDRISIIRLLPGNRIRLLLARAFTRLPDGPMQAYFKAQAQNDYFSSRFDRPDELMLFVTGRLSGRSTAAMIARLTRVAHEFGELHREDGRLGSAERRGLSMLVAIRPWELSSFQDLRRPGSRRSRPATPAPAAVPRSVRPR